MSRSFIRLTSDEASPSLDFLFKVVMGTWKPELLRTQNRRRTITGAIDTAEGAIIRAWNFVILVPETQRTIGSTVILDSNGDISGSGTSHSFGTLGNLMSLFSLNDPTASPSSRLYFYDFTTTFSGNYHTYSPRPNVVHYVEMVGKLSQENLSPVLLGQEAHYYVPITLEAV